MPPQRGRMRRTCWRPSTTTLFKPSVVPWTPFTNCQKKERSLPAPPVRRIAPIHQRGRIYTFTPLQTLPLSAETLINEKPLGSLVPGASVPMTRPAHAPPGKAT